MRYGPTTYQQRHISNRERTTTSFGGSLGRSLFCQQGAEIWKSKESTAVLPTISFTNAAENSRIRPSSCKKERSQPQLHAKADYLRPLKENTFSPITTSRFLEYETSRLRGGDPTFRGFIREPTRKQGKPPRHTRIQREISPRSRERGF